MAAEVTGCLEEAADVAEMTRALTAGQMEAAATAAVTVVTRVGVLRAADAWAGARAVQTEAAKRVVVSRVVRRVAVAEGAAKAVARAATRVAAQAVAPMGMVEVAGREAEVAMVTEGVAMEGAAVAAAATGAAKAEDLTGGEVVNRAVGEAGTGVV